MKHLFLLCLSSLICSLLQMAFRDLHFFKKNKIKLKPSLLSLHILCMYADPLRCPCKQTGIMISRNLQRPPSSVLLPLNSLCKAQNKLNERPILLKIQASSRAANFQVNPTVVKTLR